MSTTATSTRSQPPGAAHVTPPAPAGPAAGARHALGGEDLAELRALLLRLREENEADLRRARHTLTDLGVNGLLVDPSLREESTNAQYLLEDATEIIGKVDAALALMDAGSYGTCGSCGRPIPLARLRVRPYQPCVSCSA